MDTHVSTFHGSVYGKKLVRKESDLPADLTNASAATRHVFAATVGFETLTAKHKSNKPPKKVAHKRISSSGDELQNQVDAGWVHVNLSLMAVTDLIHLAKKLTKGVGSLQTLKLECFPKEYDRLEVEAHKQRCKPKYSLASVDHDTLVKSTVELACNPKLKGRIPSAIKEALANAPALQELTIGLLKDGPGTLIRHLLQNLPSVVWKALGLSMTNHQNLQVLSLAGSGIGDATLQALSEGLRSNQTIAELNLSGCKITDEGVKVLASIIKANAAEADVQAWHEGLREYPDLSLEPHLRRQQFRAKSQEIRGRVLARCGGLQILHLAENKITDSGADLLLDALAIDRSMALLDLAANQLTVTSGKAFSRLLKKHKGLLRINLRGNAYGMSGVLEMMPKGSAKAATALSLPGSLGDAQQMPQTAKMPSTDLLAESYASQENGSGPRAVAVGGGSHLGLEARVVGSKDVKEQKGAGKIASHKATRKGMVPMFTPEGQQTLTGTGKENLPTGQEVPAEPRGLSKRRPADPQGPKGPHPAGKAQAGAQHVRQRSTARTAGFEFQKTRKLQPQPTAHLSGFVPAAVASDSDQDQDEAAAASLRQQCQAEGRQGFSSALQDAADGSATFGDWINRSFELDSQACSQSQSVLPGYSAAAVKLEHPRTAGIAGSARRTVSFQEHDVKEDTDHSRGQQGNAVDLASDPAYIQGMSQAWREVEEAEDLGRQRAAADFDHTLHQLSAPAAACYAHTHSTASGNTALHEARQAAVDSLAAELTQPGADRKQQRQRPRPSSAYPSSTGLIRQSGAAGQQGSSHSRAGSKTASMPDRAMLRTEATPPEEMSAGDSAESPSAAALEGGCVSGLPDQAAAAAAALEAAKMNVWRAEVMCELEGLKCSLEGAAADRRRAEGQAARLGEENKRLRLASTHLTVPVAQPTKKPPSTTGLKATSSHQASRTKKAVARKQKRKSKAADPMDDAAEAVLQGQQQVLGDLSQVIRSLDELVSDIEDTSVVTNKHPMLTHGRAVMRQAGQQQQQQLSQPSVTDVVAAVARQLSEKFDLHDSFASLANH